VPSVILDKKWFCLEEDPYEDKKGGVWVFCPPTPLRGNSYYNVPLPFSYGSPVVEHKHSRSYTGTELAPVCGNISRNKSELVYVKNSQLQRREYLDSWERIVLFSKNHYSNHINEDDKRGT
jgi:hypothetical protein